MGNSVIQVPSNPDDRKKLCDGIKEVVNSMARIQGEQEYIKDALKELSETYQIEKKYLSRMAKEAFKDEFSEKKQEYVDYVDLYEAIMFREQQNEDQDDDEGDYE